MVTPVRTDADWTLEGRARLGHEVLDLAPTANRHPCWTGWYADHLGIDAYRMATMLRPLLDCQRSSNSPA